MCEGVCVLCVSCIASLAVPCLVQIGVVLKLTAAMQIVRLPDY